MKNLIFITLLFLFVFLLFISCPKTHNSPGVATTPTGHDRGMINTSYSFSSSANDPDGNDVSLRFTWSDGDTSEWSSYVISDSVVTMNHIWSTADTYEIRAQAKNAYDRLSLWSESKTFIISSNHPPLTPPFLYGPTSGIVNLFYNFSTQTHDPDSDNIAYQFDWGNGSVSNWSNFVPSDSQFTTSNCWTDSGQYLIKARAKDVEGNTSDWSYSYLFSTHLYGSTFPNHMITTIPAGNQPKNAAALPNSNYIYVTNENSNNISVIRTSDNTVIATVPVGSNPYGIATLPSGNFIYVTNQSSNNVSVIRTSDNTVIATIPVGTNPAGITALPNCNFVYVANSGNDYVSVIRTSDNTVITTITVGNSPWDLTALPNGNYVYVTNMGSSSISVIRTSDNIVVATIPLGNLPYNITALPNNDYVYATTPFCNCVAVIRVSDNTLYTTVEVQNSPYGITALPSGDYIYVANSGNDNVSVIATSDNTIVAQIPVHHSPNGIIVLPNGNYLYVMNSNSDNISVIGQ